MRWKLTSLSDTDDIVTTSDGREAVLLDRGGSLIQGELNVLHHSRVQACLVESHDRVNLNGALLLKLDWGHARGP